MKVIVIGASGTIGRAVVEQLGARHDVIPVAKTSGQHQVDITDMTSVRGLFEQVGKVDAVVVAAGSVHFGLLSDMTPALFGVGLQDKLMGQVNVALAAQHHLNDAGSITLTSGIVGSEPIRFGANAATVNAAVEGFARAAAVELPRGIRINVVNPTVLQESMTSYGSYFHGFEPVPAQRVALAYVRRMDGLQTGQVLRVW
jgi:NAD(P)-dependent dehydrogenase (short-subunit alcohol dehydrogenase family)